MNRWVYLLKRFSRRLWVRASLYAVLGVGAALIAAFAGPFVPDAFADRFGGNSVEAILTILASSMLAVATFSLGAMVTAYTSVSSAATPRVAELVTGDQATQKSLATFVGVFLYAIIGVVALNAHYYGPEGRAFLFLVTLAVVGLVAFRLLAWVSRLSSLARVGHMIELVEARTRDALRQRMEEPCFGGAPGHVAEGCDIAAPETGYVLNIDRDHLQATAEALDGCIEIVAAPGHLVRRGEAIARLSRSQVDEDGADRVRAAFAIGAARSFDQDPRFGLVVLGEIAGKALSPGINDPGTAVQVMATGLRLMEEWDRGCAAPDAGERPRLMAAPLDPADLLDDIFGPAMRYGAADPVVSVRLQKILRSLARLDGPVGKAAETMAAEALHRSLACVTEDGDRRRLEAAAR